MTRRRRTLTVVEIATQLALEELHATLDVRPRPGPVRCDVDRRRRLRSV